MPERSEGCSINPFFNSSYVSFYMDAADLIERYTSGNLCISGSVSAKRNQFCELC